MMTELHWTETDVQTWCCAADGIDRKAEKHQWWWFHLSERRHRLPGELSEEEYDKRFRNYETSWFLDESFQWNAEVAKTLLSTQTNPGAIFQLNALGPPVSVITPTMYPQSHNGHVDASATPTT